LSDPINKIEAIFYQTLSGNEPVREWLLALPKDDRKSIGVDIARVQYGWPVGMPTCRAWNDGVWEVRSNLASDQIARILFCFNEEKMVLLHGFIKKSQKTPESDLSIGRTRKKEVKK